MGRYVFLLVGTFLLLHACKSSNNAGEKKNAEKEVPFFFRMNTIFTEAEKNVSFPLWFNDSLVALNQISKVTRSFYLIEEEEGEGEEKWELTSEIPREKREYWFSANGQIEKMAVTYYYDNQEIGKVSFLYSGEKDKFGFAQVTRNDGPSTGLLRQAQHIEVTEEDEDDDLSFYFTIHQKVKITNKYVSYQNDQTGDYLFYMFQEKYWGPLSVDSILRPTPKDFIVLGKPYTPSKIYRVKNKVNEMDVQNFVYHSKKESKNNRIKTITRNEYPFEHKRSIIYTKNGVCNAYIDSTFSDNKYLTRTLSEIEVDAKKLPIKITHKKENQLNNTSRISIELLTYE